MDHNVYIVVVSLLSLLWLVSCVVNIRKYLYAKQKMYLYISIGYSILFSILVARLFQ